MVKGIRKMRKIARQYMTNPKQVWYDAIDDFTLNCTSKYRITKREAVDYYKKKIRELEVNLLYWLASGELHRLLYRMEHMRSPSLAQVTGNAARI